MATGSTRRVRRIRRIRRYNIIMALKLAAAFSALIRAVRSVGSRTRKRSLTAAAQPSSSD